MGLRIVPVDRKISRRFIAQHHRHARPPSVAILRVGVEDGDGLLVGVALGARPLSRHLCDGTTLEVSRVCTNGTRNAASMLYAALARAARALGYRRLVTYTLEHEPGSSLKAVGFVPDEKLRRREPHGWQRNARHAGGKRSMTTDLFGELQVPDAKKRRWWMAL